MLCPNEIDPSVSYLSLSESLLILYPVPAFPIGPQDFLFLIFFFQSFYIRKKNIDRLRITFKKDNSLTSVVHNRRWKEVSRSNLAPPMHANKVRAISQDSENMVSIFFLPKQKLILLHKF